MWFLLSICKRSSEKGSPGSPDGWPWPESAEQWGSSGCLGPGSLTLQRTWVVFFVPPPLLRKLKPEELRGPALCCAPPSPPVLRLPQEGGPELGEEGLLCRPLASMTGCGLSPPSLAPRGPPLPGAVSWRPGEEVGVPRLTLVTVLVQNTCFSTKAVFSLWGAETKVASLASRGLQTRPLGSGDSGAREEVPSHWGVHGVSSKREAGFGSPAPYPPMLYL